MTNRITLIIILVSIILLAFVSIRGIKIGSFEILSISQLIEKNNKLDEKINDASTLTSIKYPESIEKLDTTFDSYIIQKQKYEELVDVSSENGNEIYETKQYDISYLWRTLGKYAESNKLTLGLDVQKSDSVNDLYNFNFSVKGEYVDISEFIKDIEDDSDLYFRIYNFEMAGEGKLISASFQVKDVNIDPKTIKKSESSNKTSDIINNQEESASKAENKIDIFKK